MDYNERKLSVLEAMEDLEEARAYDIVEHLDISLGAAKMALSRYHRQGLLNRKKGLYWLSNRGFERLQWLQSNV